MAEGSPLATWSPSEFEEAAQEKGVEAGYPLAGTEPGRLDITEGCVLLTFNGGAVLPVWPEPTSWNPATQTIEFVSPLSGTEYERAELQDGDRLSLGGVGMAGDIRNIAEDYQYWVMKPTTECEEKANRMFIVNSIRLQ